MTRFIPAATSASALRALGGIGAVLVLAVAASGCASSGPAATPTADPFAGLADRSDQAFREGLEAYGQGQYRDALTAFERAKVLSPSGDPKIIQMIDRTRAAMAPTATPVPPTATSVPVPPTATPVAMATQTADGELGRRYFGQVTLAMVPGRETDVPAAKEFFFQDQVGLRIEGLKQHVRLPFTMRVFNTDTAKLVAAVESDGDTTFPSPTAQATATPRTSNVASRVAQAAAAGSPTAAPTATTDSSIGITRFWDTYVWYHKGGEEPGRYRVELFANGVLTHSFDYTVGTVPVPTPEVAAPTAPALDASPSVPTVEPEPIAPPPPPAPVVTRPQPAPAAPAPVAAPTAPAPTPAPTVVPSPTPLPAPQMAAATTIGGLPAGLDVNPNDGRVFVADGSGVLWTTDPAHPTTFNRPTTLGSLPVDVAVDPTTNFVFVSARNESAVLVLDGSARRLASIQMPVAPGDLQLDAKLGLLYVVLPERQSLAVVDARAGRVLKTIESVPQITSLAIDAERHVLYATHLGGQLTVVDVAAMQVTARFTMTGAGLSGVAAARGLVYGINPATHELAVAEPLSQGVLRYTLAAEPAAVAASEATGSVYVLASKPNAIVRLDPSDGSEVGRVNLPERSGRFGIQASDQADFHGLRARMVLDRADESLYVTLPEAGSLSAVPTEQFPPLDHDIPWVETPRPALVATIPGVIRPGAPALPSQPAPALQAQTQLTSPDAEEAN
jgi:hypothetical protein